MADEHTQELTFPVAGIDLNNEFQQQPPETTPVGLNVRAKDILELRIRGGQRPGLTKYIAEQIPEGAVLIQHLNYIVDPSEAALRQVFATPFPDWVEDPRNPGFFIPPGGWGNQPNPNSTPNSSLHFVQFQRGLATHGQGNTDPSPLTITIPSLVNGQFIVVGVLTDQLNVDSGDDPGDQSATVTVKNLLATSLSQVSTYASGNNIGSGQNPDWQRLSVWYKVVTDPTNDGTINIGFPTGFTNINNSILVQVTIAVYAGVDPLAGVTDFKLAATSSTLGDVASITVGSITPNDKGAVVGVCMIAQSSSPSSPLMSLRNHTAPAIYDKYPATPASFSVTFNFDSTNYIATAAIIAIKKAP